VHAANDNDASMTVEIKSLLIIIIPLTNNAASLGINESFNRLVHR
jgi:hypothetical protein